MSMKAAMTDVVKRSRTNPKVFYEVLFYGVLTEADANQQTHEMCLFYADFKHCLARNGRISWPPQGLVNHVAQGSVNHVGR
jgi:hypothetical protein